MYTTSPTFLAPSFVVVGQSLGMGSERKDVLSAATTLGRAGDGREKRGVAQGRNAVVWVAWHGIAR